MRTAHRIVVDMPECHCGKDGHALNSVNCPVHGYVCPDMFSLLKVGMAKAEIEQAVKPPVTRKTPATRSGMRIVGRLPDGGDWCLAVTDEGLVAGDRSGNHRPMRLRPHHDFSRPLLDSNGRVYEACCMCGHTFAEIAHQPDHYCMSPITPAPSSKPPLTRDDFRTKQGLAAPTEITPEDSAAIGKALSRTR